MLLVGVVRWEPLTHAFHLVNEYCMVHADNDYEYLQRTLCGESRLDLAGHRKRLPPACPGHAGDQSEQITGRQPLSLRQTCLVREWA